jgi:hypothetical protein
MINIDTFKISIDKELCALRFIGEFQKKKVGSLEVC